MWRAAHETGNIHARHLPQHPRLNQRHERLIMLMFMPHTPWDILNINRTHLVCFTPFRQDMVWCSFTSLPVYLDGSLLQACLYWLCWCSGTIAVALCEYDDIEVWTAFLHLRWLLITILVCVFFYSSLLYHQPVHTALFSILYASFTSILVGFPHQNI